MSSNPAEQNANLPSPQTNKSVIHVGKFGDLDLSELTDVERAEIKKTIALGDARLHQKMVEFQIDNQALEGRIHDISDKVARAGQAGASATVTGAYDDSMGRTEVIIGNTEHAARGKLDRSQKGESDQTLLYVIIAGIVIVIVAAIIAGG